MDKSQDSKQELEKERQEIFKKLAENESKLRVNELKIGYYLSLGMVLPKGFQL